MSPVTRDRERRGRAADVDAMMPMFTDGIAGGVRVESVCVACSPVLARGERRLRKLS